jgi:hypothetical protein
VTRLAALATAALLSACLRAAAPEPPAPQPEPEPDPFPFEVVWSAGPDLTLAAPDEPGGTPLALFSRLEVFGRDSLGLRVACAVCPGRARGIVSEADVVFEVLPPEIAAWGTLAEFALAVRDAAERLDLAALRPILASDFSFSFVGPQTPETAFDVWRFEQFATLRRVPELLDQGLTTRDGRIWAAPPRFYAERAYGDLRLGFRRDPSGRWEWLFLIEPIIPLDRQ